MRSRGAAAIVFLLAAVPASARKEWPRQSTSAPAWVREAATLPTPRGGTDVAVLHDELIVEPLASGGVRETTRFVARALTVDAVGELDASRLFYRRGDTVEAQAAWILLPDGEVRTPDPKEDISDLPAAAGISVHDDSRLRYIDIPGVPVGAAVGFEDVVVRAMDHGVEDFAFGDADGPTALSRFTVRAPAGWTFETKELRTDGVARVVEGSSVSYTARDLAPLPRIELPPPDLDRLPRAWVRWWSPDGTRGFRDWDAVGRWYHGLTSGVLAQAGEAAELGARLKPAEPAGLLGALEKAFAFAARDVRYVSIQLGIGGWKPDTPASVCEKRYGDCKAKSFLVRAMASRWGVTTYPVLVLTRGGGELAVDVPGLAFDHCIAGVLLPDGVGEDLWAVADVEGIGRVLFLDATDSVDAPWDLPAMDQGTTALLVHESGGKLVKLPVQPPHAAPHHRIIDVVMDAGGNVVSGTSADALGGGRAGSLRARLARMSLDERRRTALDSLAEDFPGALVEALDVAGLESPGATLELVTRFRGGRLAKAVAGMLVLEPRGALGGVETVLPPPPRAWPLFVGSPFESSVELHVTLPPGVVPEALPRPFRLTTEHLRAVVAWSHADGRLTCRRTVRLLSNEVPPEDYAAYREAGMALREADGTAIVLVQQAAPAPPTGR